MVSDVLFKVGKRTHFQIGAHDVVFVGVVQHAALFERFKEFFGVDVIPVDAAGRDAFDVLHEEFLVDAAELEALMFEFFGDLVPAVIIGEVEPFRAERSFVAGVV